MDIYTLYLLYIKAYNHASNGEGMKLLVISDVHSNYDALSAVLKDEKYDKMIFLGDLVDYGPEPAESLDLIRENADYFIMGNHDASLAYGIDCQCSQEMHELSVYTLENITKKFLDKKSVDFIRGWKNQMRIEFDSTVIYATHASPYDNLFQYVNGQKGEEIYRDPKMAGYDYIFLGHTHYPMMIKNFVLNPGSVGQPRDRDKRSSYILLDTDKNSIEFKRKEYDTEKFLKKLRERMNNDAYFSALSEVYTYRKPPESGEEMGDIVFRL